MWSMARVVTGLEVFLAEPPAWVRGARLGFLNHIPSVGPDFTSARELIARRFPGQLQVLFSPQHGLLGEKQDNMIASADFRDPLLKLPVLDRPNPISGAAVEGNLLHPQWASFVGPYPLPMRHGFSLGELVRYYRVTQDLECDLEVVPARGWRRGH